MRMYDIIAKKRDGGALSAEELAFLVQGFTKGDIPDYQMSAFLMAVYLKGMTDAETAVLTLEMAKSGEQADLSAIYGVKADKHSTGGVGDKTTLITAPIVAACGVKVAKMSGRGLGHTGGTVDKLEAIPGFCSTLSPGEFAKQVNRIGLAVIGQSGNIAPADKKLYALRDVTATVSCVPLIASSIMSKKLAAGSDCILLDVKTGNGAFMKTFASSQKLAETMVAIGEMNGRRTAAVITDMDTPLGYAIGNSLEVQEAAEVLSGAGPDDLRAVSFALAARMLVLAGMGELDACMRRVHEAVENGSAKQKLREMVAAQGGDARVLDDASLFKKAAHSRCIYAETDGYLTAMDTEKVGIASVLLGAGREKKDDKIDYSAGILLFAKTGDKIVKGDLLATLYADNTALFDNAEALFREGLCFGDKAPCLPKLIMAYIDKNGTVRYE